MKKIKFTALHLLLLILILIGYVSKAQTTNNVKCDCKSGDLIFIKDTAEHQQSKNKYNYVGIILIENNAPMVYYATNLVTKCSLSQFINLSLHKKYAIKHLIEQELLSPQAITTMQLFAKAKLDTNYNNNSALNNTRFYNTEFVWEAYKSATGLPLCTPKIIQKQSDDAQIATQKVVVIKDIFDSQFIEE